MDAEEDDVDVGAARLWAKLRRSRPAGPWETEREQRAPEQLPLPGFRDRPFVGAKTPQQVLRWVLRVLARTEVGDLYRDRRRQPGIDALLGISDVHGQIDSDLFRQLVVRRLDTAEAADPDAGGPLQENISLLASALDLTAVECELLELRAQVWTQPLLGELFRDVMDSVWPDREVVRVLAVAFDRDEGETWPVLDRDGALARAGLIRIGDATNHGFLGKLEIPLGLSNALHRPARDVVDLLSFAVREGPGATIGVADFPHLAAELDALSQYLRTASRERMVGVNVLLHGRPGVGKTELARALPQALGLRTFEISADVRRAESRGLDARSTEESDLDRRLARYRMTQGLLGDIGGAVVIFDEIENALPRGRFFGEAKDSIKGRVNELLETNRLPAFWIANDIGRIDPAYVRRFDFVLELKTPPRSVRKSILQQCLADLPVSEAWLERQARDAEIAPATATRIARVLRTLDGTEPARIEAAYESLSRQHKVANGVPIRRSSYPTIDDYRPEWLNVDADIPRLIESLRRRPRGRLLFHGPPGTGKTGLAHHLAVSIDRPLLVKRASDLVSMWLGETEKNLCAMFEEAAADDSVLLLDEADSFLQERGLAHRSWEVTEVNELLTQMEGFEGLFICATNFLDRLDGAAMRRFSLKLGFKPLRMEQAGSLFEVHYRRLSGRELSAHERSVAADGLRQCAMLTPGDFAAAANRWELLDRVPTPDEFLDALREECALKPGGAARGIGF